MIESIDIGEAIDRGDKKAKQAGSRLSEMFVVASRFRSVIAGLSAMAKFAPVDAQGDDFIASPAIVQPNPRNPCVML
ncbi:MAG TPA: hypothetical protein VL985_11070 [Stellaceae bacterium]|nr:hypothetical protein [Stellaceae bacterium]